MRIETIRCIKKSNDSKNENTYMIRKSSNQETKAKWHQDELCFVRDVSSTQVKIFRPFDGKEYILSEEDTNNFIIVGVNI
jgi:hypothetical protein